MPQVARDVVKERARRLRRHGEAALRRHLDSEVGAMRHVLTESEAGGHSEHFIPVRFAAGVASGAVVRAKIIGHDGRCLTATA